MIPESLDETVDSESLASVREGAFARQEISLQPVCAVGV